ncbi:tetratricopeptide repeat protein [Leptospira inadai serovar Lyme str. 10]|uniref:Tetratricopeptide repeat protein n=2 Tax=Leptospira inadai serovar Lyme TaxID=293084 RepID=V6HEP2_9LEPT|nr:tetratricopeptide repeat protein [Leptospira inadai]EQA38891.1 tetratricopeptide repeat protein [Leptospira inadai serovar Lyme str. 10]
MNLMKYSKRLCIILSIIVVVLSCKSNVEKGKELNAEGVKLMSTDPEKAVLKFKEAATLNPNVPDYISNAGTAYLNQKKIPEALQEFNTAIKIDPAYGPAYYNRGTIYSSQGKYYPAIEDYREALRLSGEIPEIIYNLALAYENVKNDKLAIESYSRFIEIAPSNLEPAIEEAKSRIEKLVSLKAEIPTEKRKTNKKRRKK